VLFAITCGAVAFLAGAATGKRGAAIAAGAGFAVLSYFADSLAEITSLAAWYLFARRDLTA
jgi:hypothetical protein